MTDVAEALHVALKAALSGSAELATAIGGPVRVFASAPANVRPPYLLIGDDVVLGDDDACGESSEITSTVNVWVKPDPPEPLTIRRAGSVIRSLFGPDFEVPGFAQLQDAPFESAQYVTDPDGSDHAILTFRFVLEPAG